MTVDPRALLVGAVDTHVHSAPDLVPRKLDDVEVARQARDACMAAVVLKNHFLATALRASLVESLVPGIRVIDSLSARAIDVGVRRIVVTHPELPVVAMPAALQQRLAQRGVYFERTFNVTRPPRSLMTVSELAARIRE